MKSGASRTRLANATVLPKCFFGQHSGSQEILAEEVIADMTISLDGYIHDQHGSVSRCHGEKFLINFTLANLESLQYRDVTQIRDRAINKLSLGNLHPPANAWRH